MQITLGTDRCLVGRLAHTVQKGIGIGIFNDIGVEVEGGEEGIVAVKCRRRMTTMTTMTRINPRVKLCHRKIECSRVRV